MPGGARAAADQLVTINNAATDATDCAAGVTTAEGLVDDAMNELQAALDAANAALVTLDVPAAQEAKDEAVDAADLAEEKAQATVAAAQVCADADYGTVTVCQTTDGTSATVTLTVLDLETRYENGDAFRLGDCQEYIADEGQEAVEAAAEAEEAVEEVEQVVTDASTLADELQALIDLIAGWAGGGGFTKDAAAEQAKLDAAIAFATNCVNELQTLADEAVAASNAATAALAAAQAAVDAGNFAAAEAASNDAAAAAALAQEKLQAAVAKQQECENHDYGSVIVCQSPAGGDGATTKTIAILELQAYVDANPGDDFRLGSCAELLDPDVDRATAAATAADADAGVADEAATDSADIATRIADLAAITRTWNAPDEPPVTTAKQGGTGAQEQAIMDNTAAAAQTCAAEVTALAQAAADAAQAAADAAQAAVDAAAAGNIEGADAAADDAETQAATAAEKRQAAQTKAAECAALADTVVTICHDPGGDNDPQAIDIAIKDLPAHINAHGGTHADHMGDCPVEPHSHGEE
jgi:hypothetical protein